MERTRNPARRLTAVGEIDVTQQGRVVDPSTTSGPIRLRRRGGERVGVAGIDDARTRRGRLGGP
jgi:hypothetical protein